MPVPAPSRSDIETIGSQVSERLHLPVGQKTSALSSIYDKSIDCLREIDRCLRHWIAAIGK